MEVETSKVNGVSDSEVIDTKTKEEKILKPRKPSIVSDNISNGIENQPTESTEIEVLQNGHEEKQNGHEGQNGLHNDAEEEKKEMPVKRSKRESKFTKEATPKPEHHNKRELRRKETPQKESTPKPEVPETRRRGTPMKDLSVEKTVESITSSPQEKNSSDKNKSKRDIEEICEASTSSSVICLGSPKDEEISQPKKNIKSRKPLNSFSRFPGRNVSIISLDEDEEDNDSLKRKADDFFDNENKRKRFAGETESGSEKSPGWNFFSSTWSPVSLRRESLLSSTPFNKKREQDSMAVNFDEETKMSLGETVDIQTDADVQEDTTTKSNSGKWCSVM